MQISKMISRWKEFIPNDQDYKIEVVKNKTFPDLKVIRIEIGFLEFETENASQNDINGIEFLKSIFNEGVESITFCGLMNGYLEILIGLESKPRYEIEEEKLKQIENEYGVGHELTITQLAIYNEALKEYTDLQEKIKNFDFDSVW